MRGLAWTGPPVEYEANNLAEDIVYLAKLPQAGTAWHLGVTERGWRKIVKGESLPKSATCERIRQTAEAYRSSEIMPEAISTRFRAPALTVTEQARGIDGRSTWHRTRRP